MKKTAAFLLTLMILTLCAGCETVGQHDARLAANARRTSAVSSSPASSADVTSEAVSSAVTSSAASEASKSASSSVSKAPSTPSKTQAPAAQTVTLTIDASKAGSGRLIDGASVTISGGDTVFAVLSRACAQKKIAVSESGGYVSAIDGIAQFDHGDASGWLYSVNGSFPGDACTSHPIKNGDRVVWVYTLDDGATEKK